MRVFLHINCNRVVPCCLPGTSIVSMRSESPLHMTRLGESKVGRAGMQLLAELKKGEGRGRLTKLRTPVLPLFKSKVTSDRICKDVRSNDQMGGFFI